MLKEIKIKIENINSLNDKISIETEIEVLNGVEGVNINGSNGNCFIKFEEDKISKEEIFRKIESLNFKITEELFTPPFQKDKDFDEMENGKNKNAKEHVNDMKDMKATLGLTGSEDEDKKKKAYVDDIAEGFVLATLSNKAKNEIFNITRGEGRTLKELSDIFSDLVFFKS